MNIRVTLRHCALLLLIACVRGASADVAYYDAIYQATIDQNAGTIHVELNLRGEHLPSRVVLSIDPQRHKNFRSTDPLQIGASHVTWRPQGKASRLRYEFVVNHQRAPQRY